MSEPNSLQESQAFVSDRHVYREGYHIFSNALLNIGTPSCDMSSRSEGVCSCILVGMSRSGTIPSHLNILFSRIVIGPEINRPFHVIENGSLQGTSEGLGNGDCMLHGELS